MRNPKSNEHEYVKEAVTLGSMFAATCTIIMMTGLVWVG